MNLSPIIAYHVSKSDAGISKTTKKKGNIDKLLAVICAVLAFLFAIGALVCTILHTAHLAVMVLGLGAFAFFLIAMMFFVFSMD